MSGSRHAAIFAIFSHGIYWKLQYLSYFWSKIALFFIESARGSTGLALKVAKVAKVVKVVNQKVAQKSRKAPRKSQGFEGR
jgi:hypothetical protein